MPQYLKIAENIYSKIEVEGKFSIDPQELLDSIFRKLRKELIDTDLKLQCQFIEIEDGFKDSIDRKINLDLSLIPHHRHKDEFVLWLASLIENVTEGGVKRKPRQFSDLPSDINFEMEIRRLLSNFSKSKTTDDIAAYFKSQEYRDQNK
ncbi:hypothetical protein J537_0545 [Acinetobacter baumannii 1437282]|nr:hypothetical protein J537_0545 [Acinetobacter baumannii 1437282]